MGRLSCSESTESVLVGARLFVGRAPGCELRLDDRRVSSMHAYLWWDDASFRVRDLGSRNGTWLDGKRLGVGEECALLQGSVLRFGAQDAPAWTFDGAQAPVAMATEIGSGRVAVAVAELLSVPPDEPVAMAYPTDAGGWVIEQNGQTAPLEDGQILTLGDQAWRFSLPGRGGATTAVRAGRSLVDAHILFQVSRDQEHVGVELTLPREKITLDLREHWWPIYVLAAERLDDRAAAEHDQGWLDSDTLIRKTGLDLQTINVYIYRARRQLAAAGIEQSAALVEVRRGQRRLGLPASQVTVRTGE